MAGESVIYTLILTEEAKCDLQKLKRSEPGSLKKVTGLLEELMHHPTTGTGHPHQLRNDLSGYWSRSITKKHRLVYKIIESVVIVQILAAYGHYDDK